jgi:peptidoglycan/LPS O-acetylase OafA/YrhL
MHFSFKRITSSGGFMPEIDGLRFIAIASVVLFHLNGFILAKGPSAYADTLDFHLLHRLLSHGHLGVPLFFVISGFILGLPFARFHMTGEGRVSLAKYFARRLTRLEPPYILAMTLLLLGALFVARTLTVHDGLKSYLASLTYCHNILYGRGVYPHLNAVAWSLEIEIQFYILAPILAWFFAIRSTRVRRRVLAGVTLFSIAQCHAFPLPFTSIFDWLQYFLVGFLLVDLYVSKDRLFPVTRFDSWIAAIFFCGIWIYDLGHFSHETQKALWETVQVVCIFIFYYYVLFHRAFRALSLRLITNVGGMCYTIYLLHYPIVSLFGNYIVRHTFSRYSFVNVPIYGILLLTCIMAASVLYFLLIERPCMDKDWVRKLIRRWKSPATLAPSPAVD